MCILIPFITAFVCNFLDAFIYSHFVFFKTISSYLDMTYHRTISPALMPPTYKQRKMKVQSIWSLLFDSPATEVKTRYPAINADNIDDDLEMPSVPTPIIQEQDKGHRPLILTSYFHPRNIFGSNPFPTPFTSLSVIH